MKKSILFLLLLATPLRAAAPAKTPLIPTDKDWIRSVEVEGGAFEQGTNHHGAQFWRAQTRYIDPDVNAFVGLLVTGVHFNDRLSLGDPNDPMGASAVWNWGAAIGQIRGKHLWEVDLMGANLGEHLAFGPAIVGEHTLGKYVKIFHRTGADLFAGTTVLDAYQGLQIWPSKTMGLTLGYRIFAADKMSPRSGPSIGFLLHFDIPKFPFIFPSLG